MKLIYEDPNEGVYLLGSYVKRFQLGNLPDEKPLIAEICWYGGKYPRGIAGSFYTRLALEGAREDKAFNSCVAVVTGE